MPSWTPEQLRSTKAGKVFLGGAAGNQATPPQVSQPTVSTPLKTRCAIANTKDVDGLNKTERDFYNLLMVDDDALKVGVQNHTLKLADDCRYTPDFAVLRECGQVVFYEVKGFFRDDAKVKIKVAARLFPEYRFILVMRDKAGPNGFRQTIVTT